MKSVVYSIVIPVYGAGEALPELLAGIDEALAGFTHEVILVDDATPGAPGWPLLKRLASERDNVTSVRLMRNTGKTGALLCGFSIASGAYIITMDDDGQHSPADIHRLIGEQHHAIVVADLQQKQEGWWRRQMGALKSWLDIQLAGKPSHLRFSPFLMVHRPVIDAVLQVRTAHPYLPALLFGATRDAVNVAIPQHRRAYGSGNFTLRKMLRLMSNLIINNSPVLLRMVSVTGVLAFMMSLLLAGYFLYKKWWIGIAVAGWTSLMVVTLMMGGLILLSIGVIGEYLIRIIRNQETRGAFLIQESAP